MPRRPCCKRVASLPGVTCFKPQGAFYAFPDFSSHYGKMAGDKLIGGSQDLADYLLDVAHVATVPGNAFGCDSCIRFSFATSDENLKKGMQRVGEALANLK